MSNGVSIIIPIYNAMPYLEDCINSITCQKKADLEVLLINNGSTDGSLSCCLNAARKYGYIRVFNISSSSIGEARNFGIKQAKYDYIMFMDADDFLPYYLVVSHLLQKAVASGSDICVGNFSRLWGDQLLHAASHRIFSGYEQNSPEFIFSGFFSVDLLSYVWAKLYKKSFLKENSLVFSNIRYAEDKLFNLQCCAKGALYSFLNKEIYVHRNNPSSVSNVYRLHSHEIWLEIARSIDRTFYGNPPLLWTNIIGYAIFFGCFFDSKMEYLNAGKSRRPVIRLLKTYALDPLAKSSFRQLSRYRNLKRIPTRLYRILVFGFGLFMRLRQYRLVSIGIKFIVDFKIDEILSDTGKKPH